MVNQRNPNNVVTSAAYLLFYRRRSDHPLGPPYIQKITEQFRNPNSDSEVEGEESDDINAFKGAGNGQRLGDSSRNGSSSAFGVAAGALALGSASAGNLPLNGAAAGTADDDSEMLDQGPAPAYDEGYGGGDGDSVFEEAPAYPGFQAINTEWSFAALHQDQQSVTTEVDEDAFDDAGSDMPMGAADDLSSRMLEDFGDELGDGIQPGMSTPLEEEVPPEVILDVDEDEVTNVVLDDEVLPGLPSAVHSKME